MINFNELGLQIWLHWRKLLVLAILLLVGPPLYRDWQRQRVADELERQRNSVSTEASFAGMMIVSAWRSCRRIGIENIDLCSAYKGELIQEMLAPFDARAAVERRDSYQKNCLKFHKAAYCDQLLRRSIELSAREPEKTN